MKTLFVPLSAALAFTGAAFADPPGHAKGESLPPGLQKQGKVPPGQAKKLWNRGETLPSEYWGYRINDWDKYGFERPRDGYRWVRVDNEAYLVDITSGLIAEAIVGAFN